MEYEAFEHDDQAPSLVRRRSRATLNQGFLCAIALTASATVGLGVFYNQPPQASLPAVHVVASNTIPSDVVPGNVVAANAVASDVMAHDVMAHDGTAHDVSPRDLMATDVVGADPAASPRLQPVMFDPAFVERTAPMSPAGTAPLVSALGMPSVATTGSVTSMPVQLAALEPEPAAPKTLGVQTDVPMARAPASEAMPADAPRVEEAIAPDAPAPDAPLEAEAPVPPLPSPEPQVVRDIPLPAARPAFLEQVGPPVPKPPRLRRDAPDMADAQPTAAPEQPSFFDRLFGRPQLPGHALGYAAPEETGILGSTPMGHGLGPGGTAVYDIAAHTVYLPDGTRLEAHSGYGPLKDDPRSVAEHMRGATPPNLYELTPREALFHGVRALRMTPTGGTTYGRGGLLTHSYMLRGREGESNGCVVFQNYQAFLRAYDNGQIRQLRVVASLN